MFEDLKILHYPDPLLRRAALPVEQFDDRLTNLAAKMLELMRAHKGVGLAAPQVGQNLRIFVMNPTGQPEDDRIYVNPILSEPDGGEEEGEEGCLSLPEINGNIMRTKTLRIEAQDLAGRHFTDTQTGYLARIWQHEFDHLNGTLIIDRMGALAKMAVRKALKDLEAEYAAEHPEPKKPPKKKG